MCLDTIPSSTATSLFIQCLADNISSPTAEDPISLCSAPVSISQDLHFLFGRKTENTYIL